MAWDDVKPNGQTLTGPEYNAMVADQKSRIPSTEKGTAGGVATLDENGQVPLAQLGNAPTGGGGSDIDMNTLREKLSPENDDWILIEDSRTGTYKRIKVGNLANIRR